MSQGQKILTYRVRQLPLEFGKAEVVSTLQRHLQQDMVSPQIEVYSLAQDLTSFHTSRTKTATVTIDPLSQHFKTQTRWDFWTNYQGSEHSVVVEREFLDFTVLNEVRDEEHALDCIAISGLGSHPFGSWQSRDGSPFMWLRDGIPHDLPGTRSIIYGYDSPVPKSNSFQRPHDIAARFVNRLRSVGFGSSQSKPVIFLAHSLGGIILKEALIILAGISDQQHSILGNLQSVIFFGTPHKGMSTEQLITMVRHQPNEDLVRDLSPDSSYLFHVEERFNGVQVPRAFRVVSFYETKTTRTVQQSSDGTWSRIGPQIRMVDRQSAIQVCSRDPEDIYSIDEDHSDIVKFPAGDLNYKCVLDCLAMAMSTLNRNRYQRLGNVPCVSEDKHSKADGNLDRETESPADSTMRVPDSENPSPKDILSSLRLEILDRRMDEVSKPHQSTFNWIFNEKALGFIDWLLKGEGVYWIQGKPGSGKSTLMKHITHHRDTKNILQRWSHPGDVITAAFFFYYRGSQIQKSFDGLIRSILLQVLDVMPQLCDFIPKECLPQPERPDFDWSSTNLDHALQSVLAHRDTTRKICLFIDALDEFDGHLEVLVDFLQTLINHGCKICFSSRPREILQTHFGTSPGINIHSHTSTDIQNYVVGRLAMLPGLRDPRNLPWETRDTINNAVKEIKQKANGVFLWVKLALDRMEKDEVVATSLTQQLREVPSELEDFYASIIERIPHEFRWETYLLLDVMLRAHDEPTTLQIFWIVKWAQLQTLDECYELREHSDFSMFCQRLKERCGGLIEIPEPFSQVDRIHLMHETVREFLGGPRFQELIVGRAFIFNAQNGYTELAKLHLVAMKYQLGISTFMVTGRPRIMQMCVLYSYLAESTTGVCQSRLIDGLQESDLQAYYSRHLIADTTGCPTSLVDFAVRSGLLIYLQRKLANDPEPRLIAHETLHSVVQTVTDMELLEHARLGWYADFCPDFSGIARIALEGTDSQFLRATAFRSLLLTRDRTSRTAYSSKLASTISKLHQSELFIDLARTFLDDGLDPNVEIPNELIKGPRPLHLAFEKITELLLNYNADPNSKDRLGRTPLDVAIQRLKIARGTASSDLIVRQMDMLMGRGACITRVGLRLLFVCISEFEKRGHNLLLIRDLPRRSEKLGLLSKFDLLVLPIISKVDWSIRMRLEDSKQRENDYL